MKKTTLFRTALVLTTAIAFLFLLAACKPPKDGEKLFTITDSMGREVGFDAYPERIVSVSPEVTEILFELKLGEKIVGTSTYCNFPEAAKTTAKVGDYFYPNIEEIIKLNPDVVFVYKGEKVDSLIEQLGEFGIPVLSIYSETVEGLLGNINLVGQATGCEEQAAALVAGMRAEIEAVQAKAQGKTAPTVFYNIGDLWTPLKSSHITELIKMAGGVNIFAGVEGESYQCSWEIVLEIDPQILLIDSDSLFWASPIEGQPGYDGLSAVKNGRVYEVNADLISRCGPRIVQALQQLSECFFPED